MRDTTKTETDSRVGEAGKHPEALADEVAALRAEHSRELAELRAEMQRLGAVSGLAPARADRGGSAMGTGDSTPRRRRRHARGAAMVETAERGAPVSRRRLFGLLGGAAAAGAGLAVAGSALGADPAGATVVTAGAADGDALQIGGANTGTTVTTSLTGAAAATTPLMLVQNSANVAGAQALQGYQSHGGATAAIGVIGASAGTDGVGVHGETFGTGGIALRGSGTVGLQLAGGPAMPPTTGTWLEGSFVVSLGHVWYCYLGGTGSASKWVKLSSALVTLAPARVYDSRVGQSPTTGPKSPITNGSTVNVDVTGTQATPPGGPSGVPINVGVSSVLGNITVVNGPNPTFLTVFAQGATPPATSNVNAGGSVVVANSFTSTLGTSNGISIKCGGGPTDFIIDIFGYYR